MPGGRRRGPRGWLEGRDWPISAGERPPAEAVSSVMEHLPGQAVEAAPLVVEPIQVQAASSAVESVPLDAELPVSAEAEASVVRHEDDDDLLHEEYSNDIGLGNPPEDTPDDSQNEFINDESSESADSFNLESLYALFANIGLQHNATDVLLDDLWQYIAAHAQDLARYFGSIPTRKTMQERHRKTYLPVMTTTCMYGKYISNKLVERVLDTESQTIKYKEYIAKGYIVLWQFTSISMSNLKEFHHAVCPLNACTTIQLSGDGVQESKTGGVTLQVFSVRFQGCRSIYPILIYRPNRNKMKDVKDCFQDLFRQVLVDIKSAGLEISMIIADNPQRAVIRQCVSASGTYPCEICLIRGIPRAVGKVKEKTVLRNVNTFQFGPWTPDIPLRSDHHVLSVLLKPGFTPNTPRAFYGVKGLSVLLELGFGMTDLVLIDSMHLLCLGVFKRMAECLYNLGRERWVSRGHKRQNDLGPLNAALCATALFSECTRRSRALETRSMRASEYKALFLYLFPILHKHTISPTGPEDTAIRKKLVCLTAFLGRCAYLPTNEFTAVAEATVNNAVYEWSRLFLEQFDGTATSYSTHALSHLLHMRKLAGGPLTRASAFDFEKYYGFLRRAYGPGTRNTPKQILVETYMKRATDVHHCKQRCYISSQLGSTTRVDNLVYTFTGSAFKFYKVNRLDEDSADCFEMQVQAANGLGSLPWSLVGVFQEVGIDERMTTIPRTSIAGKAVVVEKYVISSAWDVLHDN